MGLSALCFGSHLPLLTQVGRSILLKMRKATAYCLKHVENLSKTIVIGKVSYRLSLSQLMQKKLLIQLFIFQF